MESLITSGLENQIKKDKAREKAAWIAATIGAILCLGSTSQEALTPAVIGGAGYFILGGIAIAFRAGSDDGIRELQRITGKTYRGN